MMISLPVRFVCAVLSMAGAAGLVTISTPAVAIDQTHPTPAAQAVAAIPAALVRQG